MGSNNNNKDLVIAQKNNHTFLKYCLFLLIMFFVLPGVVVGAVMALNLRPRFFTQYTTPRPNLEKLVKTDNNISFKVALMISIPLFFVFVIAIFDFIRKMNHHLISYRPTYLCITTGVCTAIYCVTLPILLSLQNKDLGINCVVTMIFTNLFATMSMMSNLSRYVKLYLLNKRDIGKMKLFNENYNSSFPGSEGSVDEFEPNAYLKRLNALVTKKITFMLFVIPYTLLAISSIVTVLVLKSSCSENGIILYSATMFLTTVTGFTVPFILINLYPTLSLVNKIDMIINFSCLLIGSSLYVFSLFGFEKRAPGNEFKNLNPFIYLPSNSLFFIIPSFSSFFCANCIPLIEVRISDRKLKQKKMISKKDFTRLLMGSRYVDSLKSCAVRCYCVETVIFWDMHAKLMKLVTTENEKRNEHQFVHEKHKLEPMACVNISNPVPSNYELLLGLNKNIFGSSNNTILYTGGYTNNTIDPTLVNAITQGTKSFNFGEVHKQNYSSPTSPNYNNNNPSNYPYSNQRNDRNDRNDRYDRYERNDKYDRYDRYDRYDGNDRFDRNDRYDKYDRYDSNNRYDNNNGKYNKKNKNGKYNNYFDTISSDKDGLLNHHDNRGYDQYQSLDKYNGTYGHDRNGSVNININNNGMNDNHFNTNPMIRHRRTTMKNNETEILYDIFNIDPDQNQLPKHYWKKFENLYNSFISENSLATVNLDTDTVNRLKKAIRNKDFTVDMFFPAVAETVDLIYQNLYPKLLTH